MGTCWSDVAEDPTVVERDVMLTDFPRQQDAVVNVDGWKPFPPTSQGETKAHQNPTTTATNRQQRNGALAWLWDVLVEYYELSDTDTTYGYRARQNVRMNHIIYEFVAREYPAQLGQM